MHKARQLAAAQGVNPEGYRSSIVFDVDDTAKTYLEREVEPCASRSDDEEQCSHLVLAGAFLSSAAKRGNRRARIDPAGGIVGYSHVLEETAPGARLDRGAAQTVAESFLTNTLHADLSRYDFREEEANFTEKTQSP